MTAKINDLLVHHGQIKEGYRGTKRVVIHIGTRPSGVYMDVMKAAADTIEGVELVIRGELDEEVILIIAPGIRAGNASRLWIREVNSRIRNMPIELRKQLDGSEDDVTKGFAVYSEIRSFGDSGE